MRNFIRILGTAAILALASSPASAGFLGHTVSADYHWPNLGTVLYASGNAVAGAGLEFDNVGGFVGGNGPDVDFSDANIRVTYPTGWFFDTVTPRTFDGWVFADAAAAIVGVTLDDTNITGLTAAALSFDATHVYLDQLSLGDFAANSFVSIDVAFAVPEPAMGAALGFGLIGIALARRRWRR